MYYRRLLIILFLSLVASLTWKLWLPNVLIGVSFIDDRSDFLQGFEASINLLTTFVNLFLATVLWLRRPRKEAISLTVDPIIPREPEDLRIEGRGGAGCAHRWSLGVHRTAARRLPDADWPSREHVVGGTETSPLDRARSGEPGARSHPGRADRIA